MKIDLLQMICDSIQRDIEHLSQASVADWFVMITLGYLLVSCPFWWRELRTLNKRYESKQIENKKNQGE